MPFETIELNVEDQVAVLSLNRPRSLNAINRLMMREVKEAMDACNADASVGAIVVHGNGRAFCAGFDIKEGGQVQRNAEQWRTALREDLDFMLLFWDSPKPTVAAVHGYCLAGGFEIALSCDLTVAAEGTRFGEPEVRIGSSVFYMLLPWMTTPKVAKELLLTGIDKVDAQRALSVGLVNEVVPAGTEKQRAMELARGLAIASPTVMRLTKHAINQQYEAMGLRAALLAAIDTAAVVEATGREDRAEFDRIRERDGLRAALDWRNARYASRSAGA